MKVTLPKTAVDTFKKKVEEKDMHAKMISSMAIKPKVAISYWELNTSFKQLVQ